MEKDEHRTFNSPQARKHLSAFGGSNIEWEKRKDRELRMEVKEEHKALLRKLGLKDEDFESFDGELVRYEYDKEKGVRIYDPYYETSYNEYIGIDGWSAWSMENDTFMSDILKDVHEKARRKEGTSPGPDQEEIREALEIKFGGKTGKDS